MIDNLHSAEAELVRRAVSARELNYGHLVEVMMAGAESARYLDKSIYGPDDLCPPLPDGVKPETESQEQS